MKLFALFSAFAVLLLTNELHAQTFRPGLLGNGPQSLVNLINTDRLMKHGQQDGLVMFSCWVYGGSANTLARGSGFIYRSSPNTKALREEVSDEMEKARYIPALYNNKPIPVELRGTVHFSVAGGRPRLRIYLNQDSNELSRGADFIAPQLILGTADWPDAKKELDAAAAHMKSGATELNMSTDATGKVTAVSVLSEDPKGYNYGHSAMVELQHARFIPAFRDGRPVSSTFTYTNLVTVTLELSYRYR